MLAGGLEAWTDSGFPVVDADLTREHEPHPSLADPRSGTSRDVAHPNAFVPGLVESYANRSDLPLKRELTVLFADLADSTPLVVGQRPEAALAVVQTFMEIVTEAALEWCGDVKDYEGDGAMLYFESVSEAARAAFAIRDRLAAATGFSERLRGRVSLDVGTIVVGIIGSPMRRSVALIGPCINRAARMLKEIPPEGIIATAVMIDRLREEIPDLASRFAPIGAPLELKGFEGEVVNAYAATR